MDLEKYETDANKTRTVFKFTSEGAKGRFSKVVLYTKIEGFEHLYNLTLGDINEDLGTIDDLSVTNNNDRDKILATVAHTVAIFTSTYPKSQIYFEGSTEARNRLYKMAISKYAVELFETFNIQGYFDGKWSYYVKNINYSAFLISRKITKL
jgi:hypothetical protein